MVEDPHQQEREKKEHRKADIEWQETNSGRDGSIPSRQADAPIPASTIQLLDFGLFPHGQSPEDVPNHHGGTLGVSQIVFPPGKFACTGSGPFVSLQDITFLHVEAQRDAVGEPEYLCVGKMWLRPGSGLPFSLLKVYRSEAARKDRFATLRTRKRTCEAGDLVEAARCSARKKAKRAQCYGGCCHF